MTLRIAFAITLLHVQGAATQAPPAVPDPVLRRAPARVAVRLVTQEVVAPLAEGVGYAFWTYNGTVPGTFLRVRQGDAVEVRLVNPPESRVPHNVDLHAVTGPAGGAGASLTRPGDSTTFTFTALAPGLFVYHCATVPVGMHVANGMYGMILVEPRNGLPPVDREFYLMLGEFYTIGGYGEPGLQPFSMDKALAEHPDYVVFNGGVGAVSADRAIPVGVGETVRLYLGNGGPNLTASLHVIGEVFDRVYRTLPGVVDEHLQTLSVPPGAGVVAEVRFQAPGVYTLVDHSLFRAFNKGALAQFRVTGPAAPDVYAGRTTEDVYLHEGGVVQTMPEPADLDRRPPTLEERVAHGRRVYGQTCRSCHQEGGQGIPGVIPPLAGSDFLNADTRRAIGIVLNGLEGEIVVNGETFSAVMPALRLTDADIADVLTYVFREWGNDGVVISAGEVRDIRICPWCADAAAPRRP